jgi:FkbM family methyltransferase
MSKINNSYFVKKVDLFFTRYSIKLIFKYFLPRIFVKKYYQYLSSIDLEKEALLINPISKFFSNLGENFIFVDIGANHGAWSLEASKYFRFIYAFECHPVLCVFLKKRFKGKDFIKLKEVALSDNESFHNLFVPLVEGDQLTSRASLNQDANIGFNQVSFQVNSCTLDSFSLNQVALIKIDVEGHEFSVLKGSSSTIERNLPILIVEIEDRHHPGKSDEIFDYLNGFSYNCFYLIHNKCIILNREEFIKIIEQRIENNFIFIPNKYIGVLNEINNFPFK